MKLLLVLIVVMCLVALLMGKRSGANKVASPQPVPGRWLNSLLILALRVVRGGVALVILVAIWKTFKLLISCVGAYLEDPLQGSWMLAGLVFGSSMLFYFLFSTMGRIRQRVNQMHALRGNITSPLLAGRWSF